MTNNQKCAPKKKLQNLNGTFCRSCNMPPRLSEDDAREIVEKFGHRLHSYINVYHVEYYCKCGHPEVVKATIHHLRNGADCKNCGIQKRVLSFRLTNEKHNNTSQDPGVLLGNEMEKRKPPSDVISKHTNDVLNVSMSNTLKNREFNDNVIQFSELVIQLSAYNDGWIFITTPNRPSYFAHKDGRFEHAYRSVPKYSIDISFRLKYPRLAIEKTSVAIHRAFAINFSVVELSSLGDNYLSYFEQYDIQKFKENWLEKAKTKNISQDFITSIQNVFDKITAKIVLIPTKKLHADHLIPNSQQLYTAVRLVSVIQHRRDTIKRGEQPCYKSLLFDVSTFKPIFLKDYDNVEQWCFPSLQSLAMCICKAFNISNTQITFVKQSFKKAQNNLTKFDNQFPLTINADEWRTPRLFEITKNQHAIVISLAMFWTYIKEKPNLQKLYGITEPIVHVDIGKKGEKFKIENIQHRLVKHPTLPFGFISDDFPLITKDTSLIPVSLIQLKKGIVQAFAIKQNADSYAYIGLKHGKCGSHTLHKLSGEVFIPNPNNYKIIDHIDGNKMNWHPSNLRWSTISENNKNRSKTRDETFRKENEERLNNWSYTIPQT